MLQIHQLPMQPSLSSPEAPFVVSVLCAFARVAVCAGKCVVLLLTFFILAYILEIVLHQTYRPTLLILMATQHYTHTFPFWIPKVDLQHR